MTYLSCDRVFQELHWTIIEDCWEFGLQFIPYGLEGFSPVNTDESPFGGHFVHTYLLWNVYENENVNMDTYVLL
jgi:hypothetical protein